jgi:hypothetical protein
MSTLRGVETFDFLLKHDNAKNKRRKVIRVVVIIVVVLIFLIGGAVLLKSLVIDPIISETSDSNDSNDSTRPPYRPNTTTSIDKLKQNSDISKESSVCKVIQNLDEKLTPCSFPFLVAGQTFYNCTTLKIGELWCSTKVKTCVIFSFQALRFRVFAKADTKGQIISE